MKPDPHDVVTLAHGNGGRFMRELVEDVIAPALASPALDTDVDAAQFTPGVATLITSTDGFIVQPLEFPGGDIGSLAVHGTVNDLAVSGAEPRWLTVNFFIEEGLDLALLGRITASLGRSARDADVAILAGDTKVLPRGQGGGLYLATTGIGVPLPGPALGLDRIQAGDQVLVSGPIGDHGTAVLLAREAFGLRGELKSDCASVVPLMRAIRGLPGLRFMRDPTRGGLASVAHEIARATGLTVELDGASVPVRPPVESVCNMLGYDPHYLACEGRIVAIVDPSTTADVLACWRALPDGAESALIGSILQGPPRVTLRTPLGGARLLEELEDDPLPRIC